ncbi:hypothetical protein [Nocardioides sp. NPDC006273]|uniref:hypothetical protein n=1 Tax=Nocardioides sp. NPDC006273 TaxID=3155598 RepID=UPI0033BB98C0
MTPPRHQAGVQKYVETGPGWDAPEPPQRYGSFSLGGRHLLLAEDLETSMVYGRVRSGVPSLQRQELGARAELLRYSVILTVIEATKHGWPVDPTATSVKDN